MRVLLVLRGASASGKSTFVKENNLEPYSISMDNIRKALFGLERDSKGNFTIPQRMNSMVYDVFVEALEKRMRAGEFVVVDNTNTESLSPFKNLCKTYKYRLYVKDFTDYENKDEYLNKLFENNKNREDYKKVPQTIIEKQLDNLYKSKVNVSNKFLINDIKEIYWRKSDLNDYEKVIVCGDIHGNPYVFQKVLDKFNKEKDFLILTGDYVDRGPNSGKVIDMLSEICKLPNVVIIQGNHERWVKMHSDDKIESIRSRVYKDITRNEIEKIDGWKDKLKLIVKELKQCCYFEYNGQDYFAVHCSVPYWDNRVITYSTSETTYDRVNTEASAHFWNKNTDGTKLIHGHISFENGDVVRGNVFNLNSRLEFGGTMPVLTIDKNGEHIEILEDDHIYTKEELGEKWKNRLGSTRGIIKKDLKNGLFSYNFDKEVFRKRNWNEMTLTARGLFLDEIGDVIARSYNKFFNFGELSDEFEDDFENRLDREKKLEENKEWINYYKDKIKFPVKFYNKENGFLGIVSMLNDKLVFCSKSTALIEDEKYNPEEKFHANIIRTLFKGSEDGLREIFKSLNTEDKTYSLIFEIVDMENDPHLIRYNKNQITLLDIVENTLEYTNILPYTDLVKYAIPIVKETKDLVIKVKEPKETAYNFDEMLNIVDRIREEKYNEGRVAVDSDGFMFKVKTDHYNDRKQLRYRIEGYKRKVERMLAEGKEVPVMEELRADNIQLFVRSVDLTRLMESPMIELVEEYETMH